MMTSSQRELCRSLVVSSQSPSRECAKRDFIIKFPTAVEAGVLSLNLLSEAFDSKNADDLQCALIVGYAFGFSLDHLEILSLLIDVDWHHSHEDVVEALARLKNEKAIDALYAATQRIPIYLEYDENRALASKAIWAIGKIEGESAMRALNRLSEDSDGLIRNFAALQLKRRS